MLEHHEHQVATNRDRREVARKARAQSQLSHFLLRSQVLDKHLIVDAFSSVSQNVMLLLRGRISYHRCHPVPYLPSQVSHRQPLARYVGQLVVRTTFTDIGHVLRVLSVDHEKVVGLS